MRNTETNEAVIQIAGMTRSFRGHLGIGRSVAVRDLDLEVREGEVFGLLGPNGAGKTTTLKVMLGLLRPDRGTTRFFGSVPGDPAARARIGYLPENPYFYDYLTAEEFLDFYARLQGIPACERRNRVGRTLERVGLAGKGSTALRKFSKGMVQRLGLAQAIQHDPELVILDEPMSGLDPLGRREVRDLILSLGEAGTTVFFSSHILQDAEMICDRVAILQNGRLTSVGRLEEMVARQVHWYEVSLRGAVPGGVEAELLRSSGRDTLLRVPDVDTLTPLLTAARESGCEIVSIWPRRDTLEDLFMREVGAGSTEARPR